MNKKIAVCAKCFSTSIYCKDNTNYDWDYTEQVWKSCSTEPIDLDNCYCGDCNTETTLRLLDIDTVRTMLEKDELVLRPHNLKSNNTWVEVSSQLYNKFQQLEIMEQIQVNEYPHAREVDYRVASTILRVIQNHNGVPEQYYLQDINA